MRRQTFGVVLLAAAFIIQGRSTCAGQSFTGPLAERDLREHAAMLRSPYTVLWLVPRPGAEDFRAIAALRAMGGQPAIVYATNGEAAPTRSEDGALTLVAGLRKEEADEASALLGGSAWFLNLPDEPGDWSRTFAGGSPARDTAVMSLAAAIRSFRPTIAVVGRDWSTGVGTTAEERALVEVLARAAVVAADAGQKIAGPLPQAANWTIRQFYADDEQGPRLKPLPANQRADALNRSTEGRNGYRSYTGLLSGREASRYARLATTGPASNVPLGSELPRYPKSLASLAGSIRKASDAATAGSERALGEVERARNELSILMRSGGAAAIAVEDQRTLLLWKNELDLVKALLLKVPIRVTISDSVMVNRQIFTVNVEGADSVRLPGATGILFNKPAGEEWIINISKNRQFDLHKVGEFRIITPDKNIPSYPVVEHGLDKAILREPFRFSIFHEDPTRERSFIINCEARLGYAPPWGTIIHTPVVCVDPADPIIIEVRNYSRDGGSPSYIVTDSLCAGSGPAIDLAGKGSIAFDTVRLTWFLPDDSLHTDYPVRLRSGKKAIATIIGRPMGLRGDTTRRAELVAPVAGIVDRAVRRVRGVQTVGEDRTGAKRTPDACNVLVVDGEASPIPVGEEIRGWIRNGGHMVVMRETPGGWRWISGRDSVWLESRDPLSVGAVLEQVPGTTMSGLNPLHAKDFDGWPMFRARAAVQWTSGMKPEILFRSADGKPVVVTWREGKGRVTLVSLNMRGPLRELHRGAHLLLANLISIQP